jgi:hypothetical protein
MEVDENILNGHYIKTLMEHIKVDADEIFNQ